MINAFKDTFLIMGMLYLISLNTVYVCLMFSWLASACEFLTNKHFSIYMFQIVSFSKFIQETFIM